MSEDMDYGKLVAGMLRVRGAFDPTSKVAIALEMGAAAITTLAAAKQESSDGALGPHGEVERVTCDTCGAQVLCGAFKPAERHARGTSK